MGKKKVFRKKTKISAYIPFLFPFPRSAKPFHGRRTPISQVMKLYALPKTDSVEDDLQSTVPSVDRWWWKRLPCIYIKYVSKSTATNQWVVPDLPVQTWISTIKLVEKYETANWSLGQGDEEVNKRIKQKVLVYTWEWLWARVGTVIVKLFNMVDLVIRFLPVRECSARKSQFWTEERRPLGYVNTIPGSFWASTKTRAIRSVILAPFL